MSDSISTCHDLLFQTNKSMEESLDVALDHPYDSEEQVGESVNYVICVVMNVVICHLPPICFEICI